MSEDALAGRIQALEDQQAIGEMQRLQASGDMRSLVVCENDGREGDRGWRGSIHVDPARASAITSR